jgi:hypothetical protein
MAAEGFADRKVFYRKLYDIAALLIEKNKGKGWPNNLLQYISLIPKYSVTQGCVYLLTGYLSSCPTMDSYIFSYIFHGFATPDGLLEFFSSGVYSTAMMKFMKEYIPALKNAFDVTDVTSSVSVFHQTVDKILQRESLSFLYYSSKIITWQVLLISEKNNKSQFDSHTIISYVEDGNEEKPDYSLPRLMIAL